MSGIKKRDELKIRLAMIMTEYSVFVLDDFVVRFGHVDRRGWGWSFQSVVSLKQMSLKEFSGCEQYLVLLS